MSTEGFAAEDGSVRPRSEASVTIIFGCGRTWTAKGVARYTDSNWIYVDRGHDPSWKRSDVPDNQKSGIVDSDRVSFIRSENVRGLDDSTGYRLYTNDCGRYLVQLATKLVATRARFEVDDSLSVSDIELSFQP